MLHFTVQIKKTAECWRN